MGAVVGFLIISFAIWGIGDIFRGFGRSTVAKIGGTEIGFEQFRQIYNERLQQIGAQMGRPISSDQARALGLDRQILGQLISEAALDERARQLGLGIADSEVSGIPEAPKTIVSALNRFQNEKRNIEYIALGRAQAGDVPAPTPEEIASYFDTHKALFRAPEYRKLVLLQLTPGDVAKWMQVSDADTKRYYEERQSRYVNPGRRHLQQIIFPAQEEAKAAKERIDSGVPFQTIASERGLSDKDIDLGLVAKSAALAPAVQEAAFALPEEAVSAPVQSRTGFALVRVLKIEPDRVRSFEEASAEIKQDLARERTRSEINEKHDKIEDERAAGQTLTEVAQKLGLSTTAIDTVDRSGRDASGAPAIGLPPGVDVLASAFSTDVGVETDPIRLADGGYVWFEVAGIAPARERNLDEVRDQVETRWREDQIAARLKAKAGELLEKIRTGASFMELAAAEGLKVETASDLQRNHPDEKISPAAANTVFRTAKGAADTAEGQSPAERVVFRVIEITAPPLAPNTPEIKQLQETLRTSLERDLLGQYVAQVERDLGTTINQDALRRLAGGQTDY